MSLATSISNLETNISNFFAESEADVQAVIALISKEAAIAESALSSALSWVASEVPTVVPIIESAISFATTVGVASNPEAASVIAAAQVAVTALNAVAQAQGSGASDIQTLLAGYTAIKQAQGTAAAVTAAATSIVSATVAKAS